MGAGMRGKAWAFPEQRFTQTGIAWVLNLLTWICLDNRGKKSFCEKLPKSDSRRNRIHNLY